ncbi:MAG TPA: hypothetical protein VM912_22225, partial [Terriglobales bacterium]|nr:hypothetical protein [Terriglobales bacterium]
AIFAAIFLLCAAGLAGDDSPPQPKVQIPESSFISPHQYTNAFFGFALSIPGGCRFQVFDQSDSDKPSEHFLFGEKCPGKGLTTFGISATPVLGSADDDVRKAVLLPRMGPGVSPQPLSLGGRLFWKNALEEKTLWGQKVWRARYATLAKGFVVLFWMSSFDSRLAANLRQAIETIKFFEPSRSGEMAGLESRPYLPDAARLRTQPTPDVNIAQLDAGELRGNVYVNNFLGFSYVFPEDWIRSTQANLQPAMRKPDSETLISASESTATPGQCLRVLASFTRFEEGTRGLDFNPRTTLMAADPTCFIPDMKFPTSLEDKETVQSYGEALARSLAGTPLMGRQKIQLFGIDLNGHIFLEMTSSNAEPVKDNGLLRKIHSDMILTVFRNLWIIWLSESDTELEFAAVFKSSISFDSTDFR